MAEIKFFLIVFIATVVGQVAYTMFTNRKILKIIEDGYKVTEDMNLDISIHQFIKTINMDHDEDMSREEYVEYINNQAIAIYKQFLLEYDEKIRNISKENVGDYNKAINIVVKIGWDNLYKIYFEDNNILYHKYDKKEEE
jgi:hypothetical protein|nr:MAG TPA: hypothetical protein [Caudoviricetes sp.]